MNDLTFHWFLPTNGGDGRHVVGGGHGVAAGPAGRPASVSYLGQIARGAEDLGFEAALTPTGAWCEDAWLSTAMLSQVSERLKFLVAFRPGLTSPFLAAQMAGTFQNLTGGRLLLNVVTGGESHEQRMYGDFVDKDARYARCDEFLTVVRALWRGETVDFAGDHLRVEQARLGQIPDPVPAIYFGGSSPAAGRVAARHADVYLTWGEPPDAVREKVEWIRGLAGRAGPRAAVRASGCTRSPATPPRRRGPRPTGCWPGSTTRRSAGAGGPAAQRVRGPAPDARAPRRLARTTWRSTPTSGPASAWSAAVPARRWSAATRRSPTGSRSTPTLGIDEFVLSGYPHLEGAYWFGEGVLPVLAERGRWRHPAPARGHARGAVRGSRGGVVTARTAVVVGNPKPGSRTLHAARHVARELTGREADLAVDLAELGVRLFDWDDDEVRRLVAEVGDADLVVVASPTYKATYTGLLKLFLDRFAGGTGLSGVPPYR